MNRIFWVVWSMTKKIIELRPRGGGGIYYGESNR